MSKRKLPPDFLDRFMAGQAPGPSDQEHTESTHSEHIANTEGTRFKRYKSTELRTFSVRLLPRDLVALATYFTRRGVPVGQGIRGILIDWLEQRGLR